MSPPDTKISHKVHLTTHPAYPPRASVDNVSWDDDVEDGSYSPTEFTHQSVLDNDCTKKPKGWADPAVVTPEFRDTVLAKRISYSLNPQDGEPVKMVNGLPRNPMGKTGMTGRGLLGKYGPNYAADPILTRFNPETGNLEMVVIQRNDTKEWAIPGGMVDAGETVSIALKREFMEETQGDNESGDDDHDHEDQKLVREKLAALFDSGGLQVYRGYVDDPRNTDIAWMETTCTLFHIDDPWLAEHITLKAGSDAMNARWLDISDFEAPDVMNLYASHYDMVLLALEKGFTPNFADDDQDELILDAMQKSLAVDETPEDKVTQYTLDD